MSWINCIAIALVLSITVDQTWSFACTQAGLPGVYRPDATVTTTVTSSSVYYGYCGMWGAIFAANRQTSYSAYAIFHSNYEAYPWYKIGALSAGQQINAIQMQTRCDANQWWHYQVVEFRTDAADIVAIPGIQIATGNLCGQAAYTYYWQCGTLTVACLVPTAGQTHVTAQQLILDSMGNGWGQHSNTAAYFLMANEFILY